MKRRLQVFVSSTYTDLLPERQAAVSAILKAGHIPAGMELFTAGDRSQMETIKQWIDESDVYMLILGGRYGTVEKASGMGYTELEYDYAVQQSKPLFAVVITESALETKVKAGGTSYIENENPKELKQFREKVMSNISSFFVDSKDIKLCVYESLAEFAANRNLKGWVSADEFIDTKPLFDEISKLADENRQLKKLVAEQEKRASSQTTKTIESFKELHKVLKAIEVNIPASLANGKETKITLLDLFYQNRDTFINGVKNAVDTNEVETFLFFNVCPKLQIHGLTVNEKVAGVRYRRYSITKDGVAFLAEMERMLLLKDNVVATSLNADEPTALQAKDASTDAQRAASKAPAKRLAHKKPSGA